MHRATAKDTGGGPEAKGKPEGVGKGVKAGGPAGKSKVKGGGGQQKFILCHKGKVTITVGAPAEDAYLRHGDNRGACGP
jgi:hypothetical protein